MTLMLGYTVLLVFASLQETTPVDYINVYISEGYY